MLTECKPAARCSNKQHFHAAAHRQRLDPLRSLHVTICLSCDFVTPLCTGAARIHAQMQAKDSKDSNESESGDSPPPPDSGRASDDKAESNLQISRDVIKRMKDAVFSFDAFFVTETENYEADGVLFRGNLRGEPAASFEKMQRRMQNEFGDKFSIFLLQDRKEKPVVCSSVTSPGHDCSRDCTQAL